MTVKESLSSYNRTQNVLLVEDDSSYARLVEILLGESDIIDCKITNKQSLRDSLAELQEQPHYDAVLLDLSLPDSRGFSTLEHMLGAHPSLNIIVLTGRNDKDMGLHAVKAGAQDFLVKGEFDAEDLAKSLRYAIERNQFLKKLEETQRLARIGNWECEPDKHYFMASDEVYRIFGLPPRQTKYTCQDMLNPQNPFHLFLELQKESRENKNYIQKEIWIKRLDNNEERFVTLRCSARKIEGDEYYYNGIIQDFTDLKQAHLAQKESQKRYQEIFSQSYDAIYTADLNGHLLDCNDSTAKLLNIHKEELFSHDSIHNFFFPEEQKTIFLQHLSKRTAVKDFELQIARKDDQYRFCLVSTSFGKTSEGATYNCIIRDITERKQAEELRQARDIAEQTAKVREQVIAGVSHDMRTPMNAIIGMLNLLKRTELTDDQVEYIQSIKQSSSILLGIINDILQASSIKNNNVSFESERFSPRILATNLKEMLAHKVQEKALELTYAVAENVPEYIWGDQLRLNQILYNLVGNAVKFTERGKVHFSIDKLREDETSVSLKFTVKDTGIGIPPDKLEVIFQPFTRVYQKGKVFEGTGLGLSIVKNLIELQGGSISADSIPGKGSTFFFELTFKKQGVEEDTTVVESSQSNKKESIFEQDPETTHKILIVEDHKMNQVVAQKTLEEKWSNAYIKIADNGKKAIEILRKEDFDIVLMDIQMPVMDGLEATGIIRTQLEGKNQNIPILAMTAHVLLNDDESYYRDKGINDYVLKPFEPEELFQKIDHYIGQRSVST
ncbi:MAG: response regulator [Saprospiraceae bacterium]|nr:response regulator [Saprospiraceae bacterium]